MTAGPRRERLRVLELYCGIGGCAAALGADAEVVAAIDIDRTALEVYRTNFPHPAAARTIEALSAADLERWRADLWWLSPPCQPFTRRGRRRDDDDPRSASLLRLIGLLEEVPPPYLALENVPGFEGSRTHARLLGALERLGYGVRQQLLCPTELGVPNRRRRFYLLASRRTLLATRPLRPRMRPLRAFLDADPPAALWPPQQLLSRYRHAVDLVEPDDDGAVAACFTAAYGRSPVRSGSYLRTPRGPRRFSPAEILRLLGFPPEFRLGCRLPLQRAWRLVGNSLSVPAVRRVLAAMPGAAR